jgi:YbbR domain-containing protein
VGSDKQVSKIASISTKILELKDVHSSFKQSVEIHNSDDLKPLNLSHNAIEISANVEKFTEGVFDIPVTITNLPENTQINYFPKTISVVYYVSLANYKYIKPNDFRIECDYNTILNSEQSFLTPKLTKYPEQIKSARLKQSKVEFILMN